MTRKMIFLAVAFLLLASPIFAQTPAGGTADLHLPFAYLAMGIASGLCGLGQGKAVASAAEELVASVQEISRRCGPEETATVPRPC